MATWHASESVLKFVYDYQIDQFIKLGAIWAFPNSKQYQNPNITSGMISQRSKAYQDAWKNTKLGFNEYQFKPTKFYQDSLVNGWHFFLMRLQELVSEGHPAIIIAAQLTTDFRASINVTLNDLIAYVDQQIAPANPVPPVVQQTETQLRQVLIAKIYDKVLVTKYQLMLKQLFELNAQQTPANGIVDQLKRAFPVISTVTVNDLTAFVNQQLAPVLPVPVAIAQTTTQLQNLLEA